jgi:uncharacterized membrane protein YccF (DUF307 family)
MFRFLLNLLWFLLGGLVMGLGWWLVGAIAALTIVGIPWARACFVIGSFSFWPFGQEAVSRRELTGEEDLGTGPLGLLGNVIWFVVAGWWLAIGHLASALACFISIIGIPFLPPAHQIGADSPGTNRHAGGAEGSALIRQAAGWSSNLAERPTCVAMAGGHGGWLL